MQELKTILIVNGREITRTAPGHVTLLRWLRDAGVYDVKYGCGEGQCGACTVLIDGVAHRSCLTPVGTVTGKEITTIEGLADGERLHPPSRDERR